MFFFSRLTRLIIWRICSGGWGIRSAIDWFNTRDSAWYKDIAEGMFSRQMSLPFHDSNGQALNLYVESIELTPDAA